MPESQYEYRILINGIPSAEFYHKGWTKSFDKATAQLLDLREVNPRAIVMLEISPWYRTYDTNGCHSIIECPGCEYASCPVGSK